jgi:ABC-2 type transport system permease protein
MLKTLLRIQLKALYAQMFTFGRAGKKRSPLMKVLIGFFAVYVLAALGFSVGFMFYQLYAPFTQAGLRWLYFSFTGLSAFLMSFIGSAFLAQSTLYDAKDNDMLLSMPIKPRLILYSRLSILFLFTIVFQQLLLLPAAIVWWMQGPVDISAVLMYLLTSLLLPFPALALSCLGGWLLALAASRLRRRSLILTLLSVLFMGAFFLAYSQVQNYMNALIASGEELAGAISKALFPAYHYGLAIDRGSLVSLLLFTLCAVLPFLLVLRLISRRYLRILTSKRGEARVKYRGGMMKAGRVGSALLKKEILRFTSSPVYVMNSAFGLLFMLALPILLLSGSDVQEALTQAGLGQEMLGIAAAIMLCLLSSSVFISAPSISLEGKSLWILQTLPVKPLDILLAKAKAHVAVCLPFLLLSALMLAIALKTDVLSTLALFLLPLPVTVFTALLGVALNLRFPKLNWRTVTEPVKQGMSGILSMLGSFGSVAALTAAYVFLLRETFSLPLFLGLFLLFFILASALIYVHLKRNAQAAFLRLSESA